MNFIKKLVSCVLMCSLFIAFFSFMPSNVNAENDLWEKQEGFGTDNQIGENFGEPIAPQMIIINVIRVMLSMLGIIFLTIIVLSGFKYMTAGGSEDKVKEALKGIRNGIIGLLIILMSFALTNFVTNCAIDVTSNDSTSPWYCSID